MKTSTIQAFTLGFIIGVITTTVLGYFGYTQGYNEGKEQNYTLESSIVGDDLFNLNEEQTRQFLEVQEMYYSESIESERSKQRN